MARTRKALPIQYILTLTLTCLTAPLLFANVARFVAPIYGHFLASQYHFHAATASVLIGGVLGYFKAPKNARLPLSIGIASLLGLMIGYMRFSFDYSGTLGSMLGPLVSMAIVYPVLGLQTAALVSRLPQKKMDSALLVCGVLVGSFLNAQKVDTLVRKLLDVKTCGIIDLAIYGWITLAFLDALDMWPRTGDLPSPALQEKKTNTDGKGEKIERKRASGKRGEKETGVQSTTPLPSSDSSSVMSKSFNLILAIALPLLLRSSFNGGLQCNLPSVDQPEQHGKYSILARAESVTGYLSVIEDPNFHDGTRFLRCDHSLIGGAYLQYEMDSVFGSFYYLDFVRFVARKKDDTEKALQIGLGIGVTTRSLTLHTSIQVDLVELDPVVYTYARKYFDLPEPHSVHFSDGRAFLDDAPDGVYDYVLHDVFTGGLVPSTLFSVEALQNVRRVLKPNGVLALNYVGTLHSLATKSVIKTLHTVFPNLECYTEDPKETTGPDAIYNIVFFASSKQIVFLPPSEDDMARGGLYAEFLKTFDDHRVDLDFRAVDGELMTDKKNMLPQLQIESAKKHWKVMRKLFGIEFWGV
ncbi:spermidine synthase [Spizellomyces sp. 'palustris']|nr:spermidine synthase [Spizellomyces sp. 'palustris']